MTVQHQWKQFREQSCTALNNNSVLQQEEINHFHGHGRPEISGSFKSVFSWPGKVMDINQILKVMGMSLVNINFSEISVVCYCSCKGKKNLFTKLNSFSFFWIKEVPKLAWIELVWIRMIFKWLEWKNDGNSSLKSGCVMLVFLSVGGWSESVPVSVWGVVL